MALDFLNSMKSMQNGALKYLMFDQYDDIVFEFVFAIIGCVNVKAIQFN